MNLKENITNNHILAIAIGIIYLWFGSLKFFSQLSPAEDLAINTIDIITFGLIPGNISIILLAIWETVIGVFLILNIFRKPIIKFTLVHMILTFAPLFFLAEQSFNSTPFSLTLLGQYIIKNLIIIAALITLYKMPVRTLKY